MRTLVLIWLLVAVIFVWGYVAAQMFDLAPNPPEVRLDGCRADGTTVYDSGAVYDGGCVYAK